MLKPPPGIDQILHLQGTLFPSAADAAAKEEDEDVLPLKSRPSARTNLHDAEVQSVNTPDAPKVKFRYWIDMGVSENRGDITPNHPF